MCALGVLAALATALVLTKKRGENLFRVMVTFLMGGIGAFAGAMVLYALVTYPPAELWQHLKSGTFEPGFVYYGGLLGGLLFAVITAKNCFSDVYGLSRVILPAVPIGHAFGRIGCFLGGCCYGILLNNGARLPVQLMEAAYEFILFFLLLRASKKNRPHLIGTYLLLYALFRFAIEFFRGDEVRGFIGIFSVSQVISLAVMAFCIPAMVKKDRNA